MVRGVVGVEGSRSDILRGPGLSSAGGGLAMIYTVPGGHIYLKYYFSLRNFVYQERSNCRFLDNKCFSQYGDVVRVATVYVTRKRKGTRCRALCLDM